MRISYSLYEAKAKLSAIVRQVREGQHVTVTVHGEPVVEIRPVAPRKKGLAARLEDLEGRGILVPAGGKPDELRAVERRPGALERFLKERD